MLLGSFQTSKFQKRFQEFYLMVLFPGEGRPACILQKGNDISHEEINLCMSKINR